jgi:hypothetical protein
LSVLRICNAEHRFHILFHRQSRIHHTRLALRG